MIFLFGNKRLTVNVKSQAVSINKNVHKYCEHADDIDHQNFGTFLFLHCEVADSYFPNNHLFTPCSERSGKA